MTAGEFSRALTRIEKALSDSELRLDARLEHISTAIDHRDQQTTNIWPKIGGLLLTSMAIVASLIMFAINAQIAPLWVSLESSQSELQRLRPVVHDNLQTLTRSSEIMDLVSGIVLEDVRLDHGGGVDSSASAARLEALQARNTELWSLVKALELKIGKISEEVAVIRSDVSTD